MLICEHAQNLFDAYLDDELSSSMRMELNAHRLSCSRCQRQLTLLESCADVVMRDETGPTLSDDFTDRVMAALPTFAKAMTTTPQTARIYRLFAPIGAVAAAIAMVIMIAPPISSTKEATTSNATPVVDSGQHPKALTAPAVVIASEGQDGKTILSTLAIEPGQAEPILQTSEYAAPLPQVMVDGSLTPTVRSWKQLRSDGTVLRDLGKMILDRAVSNMTGEQVLPAAGAAAEPADEMPDAGDAVNLPGADEDQPL